MAIMKLSNVPELTEFAGTEKIYVNDNGETKQIACDKVVTAGGGGATKKMFVDSSARFPADPEELVALLEEGGEVWVNDTSFCYKIISFNWVGATGGTRFLSGSYITSPSLASNGALNGTASFGTVQLSIIGSDLFDRFYAAITNTFSE